MLPCVPPHGPAAVLWAAWQMILCWVAARPEFTLAASSIFLLLELAEADVASTFRTPFCAAMSLTASDRHPVTVSANIRHHVAAIYVTASYPVPLLTGTFIPVSVGICAPRMM